MLFTSHFYATSNSLINVLWISLLIPGMNDLRCISPLVCYNVNYLFGGLILFVLFYAILDGMYQLPCGQEYVAFFWCHVVCFFVTEG